MGFGLVRPRPRSATASARAMEKSSLLSVPPFLLEQRVDVLVWRERHQIVNRFADAYVSDR